MSGAAQAFAPGSVAGGAQGLAKLAGLPGLPAGGLSLPSLSLGSTSGGTAESSATFDNSGFVVNMGGAGIPAWAWLAALGALVVAFRGRM